MSEFFGKAEIKIEQLGSLGVLTLNRPEKLNALSLDMIREITAMLRIWANDPKVKAVVFKGEGARAFCAGGDIKSFYTTGMEYRQSKISLGIPMMFFKEEYALNKLIYHYSKPTISLMNGITMGGGYGIAGNAKYALATSKTVIAMPETKIGFFPDVGSMYYLSRLENNLGAYLALTGESLTGIDIFHAGLSARYVGKASVDECLTTLQDIQDEADVEPILNALHVHADASSDFDEILKISNATMGLGSVEEIRDELGNWSGENKDRAQNIYRILNRRCPLSVKVAHKFYRDAKTMSFDAVSDMDFVLASNFIKKPDMYEGIRAVLIDKDNDPNWSFSLLEDVQQDDVMQHFAKLI